MFAKQLVYWTTNQISIPRSDKQSFLTNNGLLGKIEFNEVSRVLTSQVGSSETERE